MDSSDPAANLRSRATAHLSPHRWYEQQAAAGRLREDAGQRHAISHLQRLWDELLAFKSYRERPFMKTFGRRAPPRGLYLHGGVGRGKSMLMDAFYKQIALKRKRRVHFHAFMQAVHRELAALKQAEDPLVQVAAGVARATRLLCFDEFHVSDIGDAMILGRLLEKMIEGGVVCVMTSNYAPGDLYPNGLQRERFLPTIQLIERELDVVALDTGPDYRLRALERLNLYHMPLGSQADAAMGAAFAAVAGGAGQRKTLTVNARPLNAKQLNDGAVWFEFAELCGGPRSQADYLEIAREFHTVLLSNVPRMSAEQAAEARRFTWLVDVFYDQRVNLVLSADAPMNELYVSGPNSNEFQRTVSRLQEMQSREYLSQQHVG
jgi:cell division protein ZapE